MPLQNRVTPTGELIATPHRGTLFGNRGVLHDENRRIVRRHQVKRWLICRLEYPGRHRPIMTPRRYTELFFLDEAVALAAGHRPCAECRYQAYQTFRSCWTAALRLPARPGADDLDAMLHPERVPTDGRRRTSEASLRDLPDGVFVCWRDHYWLVYQGMLARWSPGGYAERRPLFAGTVPVLTPPSTVATVAAGYRPGVHRSAEGR